MAGGEDLATEAMAGDLAVIITVMAGTTTASLDEASKQEARKAAMTTTRRMAATVIRRMVATAILRTTRAGAMTMAPKTATTKVLVRAAPAILETTRVHPATAGEATTKAPIREARDLTMETATRAVVVIRRAPVVTTRVLEVARGPVMTTRVLEVARGPVMTTRVLAREVTARAAVGDFVLEELLIKIGSLMDDLKDLVLDLHTHSFDIAT